MAESKSFLDLMCCSICLETFTRPKVLPCQHTFCYSCLLSIGKDQTTITCPQCREECDIPQDGIADFRDSIVINQLIELCHAQKDILCADCELKPASFPCDHCNKKVCASCFSAHLNLSMELKMALKEVNEIMTQRKFEVNKEQLERSKEERGKQLQDLKALYRQKLRDLFQSSRRLEKFMEMVNRVQDDLLLIPDTVVQENSYFTSLASKAGKCATAESLKDLLNDICDLKTALELFEDPKKSLRFVPNLATEALETLGHLEIGQAVIEVQGSYESDISTEELQEFFTDVAETRNERDQGAQRVGISNQLKLTGFPNYRQNQLPSNVNYLSKGLGWVMVAGQVDQSENKLDAVGAAYHVATGDVYVADMTNNRDMIYPGDGSRPCVFYTVVNPYDVAISNDAKSIYIAALCLLIKVDLTGKNVKTIHKCSLGPLQRCVAVVCHNELTVVVDRDLRSVIIFDEFCDELRCFGQEQLRDPTAVAISTNGEMFVTDNKIMLSRFSTGMENTWKHFSAVRKRSSRMEK